MNGETPEEGREVYGMVAESGMVAILNKSEIDQQIVTAHKFPRSIARFHKEGLAMVTLNEQIAQECIYALPRDGKVIEGPSARFAEIVAHAWRNCRAGARVVDDSGEFVTSQGVFHDLENNVAITYEVQRRIVDKNGKRYKADMVGVTANAASSIALRNAVLKGVPKAFWNTLYQRARQTIMGDFKTLANRRAEAIKQFVAYGVTEQMLCEKLEVGGKEDIGLEHLVVLAGLLTALKDGDTTVEDAFVKNTAVEQPTKTAAPQNEASTAGHGAGAKAARAAASSAVPAGMRRVDPPQVPTLTDCKAFLNEAGKDALPTLKDWRQHLSIADQIELDKLIEPIEKAGKNDKPIQPGQIRIIMANKKRSTYTLDQLLKQFKVEKIEELKMGQVNEVNEWLASKPL